ncbi:MAG: carboxypeptidase regulatory-like domain-containing protein, partial [Candidatus Aminicenantes bacterium]|nr:carboxypeptidase regulatory-like domain-containing protein [Candidatus Aminicenantes bacterium]
MKKLIYLLCTLILLSIPVIPQKATADIYGKVIFPDGSAISGAAVELTGDVIGKKNSVTSEEGNFRFLFLPPGNYELRFELEGFQTIIRKNIRLYLGKNITLSIRMETATIKEEIVITRKAVAVDTRRTTASVNISKEMIQSLPTARNPWTVLNLIPGVMVDREDVGGNESGQQSTFYGHGSQGAVWTIDGGNISDPSSIGAAPAYLNMNNYEELQVTLGSNDMDVPGGGIQLNFVTKRAGNNYSGDFHLYVEDKAWEMEQELPEYYQDQGWVTPGIERLYQYGLSFGGPIIKDKLWWYGAYGIQDIHSRTLVGDEDASWLLSGYLKLTLQSGNTSGDFLLSHDAKKKWGRTALSRAQQDNGTLWD